MSDLGSLIFYIMAFSFSALIINYASKISERKSLTRISIIIIGLMIPIIIGGVRYKVGTDYTNYIDSYNVFKNYSIDQMFESQTEIMFGIILKVATLFDNPQILFWIFSFLTVIVMYLSIKDNSQKLSIGLMMFIFLFLNYTTSFNIIRQALAVVIVVYAYKFVFSRELVKFLCTMLIASMFHITAILFIPFYWINSSNVKVKKITQVFLAILLLIIISQYGNFMSVLSNISGFERFESYADINNSIGNNREIIINTILLAIISILKKPLEEYDSRNKLYIYFYFISWILTFTGFISPYVKRIALYFEMSIIFLLATIPKITKNKYQKVLAEFLIILYVLGMFTISAYILKQGDIIPYNII